MLPSTLTPPTAPLISNPGSNRQSERDQPSRRDCQHESFLMFVVFFLY
ncbi:MAG TPA: hypothetical protein VNW28_08540 [Chthoniobacterales bacterium]|nr:hypothetical protein [Chthoniobacterales bacterium]